MKKFEYRVFYLGSAKPGDQQKDLEKLGDLGWELVSVKNVPVAEPGEVVRQGFIIYLKREKTA